MTSNLSLATSPRHAAREIFLARTHHVVSRYVDLHMAVAAGRRRGLGGVAEQILRAQLAIDSVKHVLKLAHLVQDEKSSACAVGNRDQRVLARRVAAALALDWPNHHGVEQGARCDSRAARVSDIRIARGLARVGNEYDRSPSIGRTAPQRI